MWNEHGTYHCILTFMNRSKCRMHIAKFNPAYFTSLETLVYFVFPACKSDLRFRSSHCRTIKRHSIPNERTWSSTQHSRWYFRPHLVNSYLISNPNSSLLSIDVHKLIRIDLRINCQFCTYMITIKTTPNVCCIHSSLCKQSPWPDLHIATSQKPILPMISSETAHIACSTRENVTLHWQDGEWGFLLWNRL